MELRVRLDEIIPSKMVSRRLPETLDRLRSGDVDQLVITRRSTPAAVLVSIERYQALVRASEQVTGKPAVQNSAI